MSDIVDQLRDRAYCGKGVDTLCERAAEEIERLRQVSRQENPNLTDEEREAIGYFAAATGPQYLEATNHYAAVAKALLERLS